MSRVKKGKARSAYAKMLGNIASDLDTLLTDLCEVSKNHSSKEDLPCTSATVISGDTLGKDSFFSSTGEASRRQGDAVSSSHSLVSLSDNDHNDSDSLDSGHGGRCRSGPSPLVFDPHHFGSQHGQCASPITIRLEDCSSMDELRPISTVERLIKTNSIWLLATMSRAGAVHILKDKETGVFIVRKSSHPNSLALSVQSHLSDHSTVDHYLIEGTNYGFRLQGSAHFFHSIPALIAYYVENIDEIPYHLRLPSAIQQARSTRELASLDMLGQDFWVSSLSRQPSSPHIMSGILHKSCSEPINIQRPVHSAAVSRSENTTQHTAASKSSSDFSHFMKTQVEMEQYFQQHLPDSSAEGHNTNINGSGGLSLPSQGALNLQCNLVSCKSQASQTPPPGGTHVGTNTVQAFSQSCSYSSKELTDTRVVNGQSAASNLESLQFTVNSQQLTRLVSEDSWVLASSPFISEFQNNNMFTHGAQNVDIYRSNPNNQPLKNEDGIAFVQQYSKNGDSSHSYSLQEKHSNSLREGTTKERSWTHPGSVPQFRSNLYFTTNLDLLNIPENSYFMSNLSDKLSDYEDIWRNSSCEGDADRKSTRMIHDPRVILDAKISGKHNKRNGPEGKRKILRKTSKASPPARFPVPVHRDAVTGGSTGLTALEQARMIAGSMSEDEASIPVAHVRGIKRMENLFEDEFLPNDTVSTSSTNTVTLEAITNDKHIDCIQVPANSAHQVKFVTSHSLDFTPKTEVVPSLTDVNLHISSSKCVSSESLKETSKCVFTTTMSVVVSEPASSENSSNANNKKYTVKPTGHLSRMKSSSESSLATVSSPLYAEPADAVKLRDKDGKAINIQVRRLSAPLAVSLKSKDKPSKDQQTKVSQNPQLDTIFSPDAQCSSINDAQSKFVFSPSTNKIVSSISRSQSMRTASEISHLQSKQSWKERLNRLKLGTKVLSHNIASPNSASFRKNTINTLDQPKLDTTHFLNSSLAQNSSALSRSFPGKFPVDRKRESNRASCFSESSTVQDLISCAHPELSIRPIAARFLKPHEKVDDTPPSEYDNLLVYRQSTHSSLGTVYSPPWEIGSANKLIRESPPLFADSLPPAMDITERIERWQQASSSYQAMDVIGSPPLTCSKNASSQTHHQGQSQHHQVQSQHQQVQSQHQQVQSQHQHGQSQHQHILRRQQQLHQQQQQQKQQQKQLHEQQLQQQHHLQQQEQLHQQQLQQQLLGHQQQIKCEGKTKCQGFHRQLSEGSTRPQRQDAINRNHIQPLEKDINRLNRADSGTNMASPPSSPQTTNAGNKSSSVLSPHRLSSHCPDVVNCHNTATSQNINASNETSRDKDSKDARVRSITEGGQILAKRKSGSPEWKTPGIKIREYIFKLSGDRQTIFGSTIENFIQCTLESQETNPQYVMRNVRQFMTGIKNYLVKHGEGELENLIERERSKLGVNEILNIDAIIEQALHICVLKPLKYHIYRLFVEKYSKNGALEQLSKNIKYARTKSAQDIGVRPGLKLPQNIDMEIIKHYLDLMQKSYSPLQKLQNLLNATSTIYHSVQGNNNQTSTRSSSMGAEDFLPILIYVIVHCGLVSAEIEADFMWGLLQPSLLTGEGGYYLTTLSSAVLILKNFQETHQLAPTQVEGKLPALSDMQGFLKIAIPDELHGSIVWRTLPVRPNMNTRDVCAMVAHKFKITNPQDYGLFLLCDGFESHMADADCPQIIKGDSIASGKSCHFAFKRLDANIAWPKHMKHSSHK